MSASRPVRYGDVATGLHWLIALLIIALLAIGKFMTELDENNPLRYTLTQWHKTFGITVLLLAVVRLLWRITHAAPGHPPKAPGWEKLAAGITHSTFYVLMFAIPMTGWIMVSASPLNIQTLLFNVIPWPHLPPFENPPDKADIAHSFAEYHELGGNLLLVLLLAHIGAALKHHVVNKDDVLRRMAPDWSSRSFNRLVAGFSLFVVVAGAALWQYSASQMNSSSETLAAGSSEVSFIAVVSSTDTAGKFSDSSVSAALIDNDPANSLITARVATASVSTDNIMVTDSLPETDWFDTENFPEAEFKSTSIQGDAKTGYAVVGNFTLKGITREVQFDINLEATDERVMARGSFDINRLDFNVGSEAQPDDSSVGLVVKILFQFEIQASNS